MTPTSGGTKNSIGHDELFSVLSHPIRRQILSELTRCRRSREDEFDPNDLVEIDEEREHIKIELYHNHLPRLEETGIVDWNRQTNRITDGEQFEEVQPLIELLHEHQEDLPADWP